MYTKTIIVNQTTDAGVIFKILNHNLLFYMEWVYYYYNHSSPGQENTIQGVNKVEDRISISISAKAYDILLEHTKQLNRENAETQNPFTIEEVLDEEIILLFGDEGNKKV